MTQSEKILVQTRTCLFCGKGGQLLVPKEALDRFDQGRGELIQNAWPEGSADEREQLLTGTHGECYDKMFKDEE